MTRGVALLSLALLLGPGCGNVGDAEGAAGSPGPGGTDGGGSSGGSAETGGTDGGGGASGSGGHGTPANAPPVILSLTANTSTLVVNQSLVVSAVVTDPDGIDDLIGGQLLDPGGNGYGSFATAAAEGAYALELSWDEINVVEPIDAEPLGTPREFVAVFFDAAGARTEQTLSVTLRCEVDNQALCNGQCLDWSHDRNNCGACGRLCPDPNGLVGVYEVCNLGRCGYVASLDFGIGMTCGEICGEVAGGTFAQIHCEEREFFCQIFPAPALQASVRAGCSLYRNPVGYASILDLETCSEVPPPTVTDSGSRELSLAEQRCLCVE